MSAYQSRHPRTAASSLRLVFGFLSCAFLTSMAQGALAADKGRVVRLTPEATQSLTVAIGATETFRTASAFVDLVVGDPDTADVMPLTDQSFYIHGRKLGTTTISAYNSEKSLIGSIEVEVSYNTNRLQAELRRRLPGSRIEVSSINGRIVLAGAVSDGVTIEKAMEFARQFGNEVVNSMTVSQPQQVMLEVRFLEVSRNAGRDLGVSWQLGSGASKFNALTGLGGAPGAAPTFGSILGRILTRGGEADVVINALEQRGLARRLAEPNLIAMSGQTASFLAGGEFPIPVQADQGRITVAYKKFGVSVNFQPTVLADGLINLKIEPEVSQLDPTNSVSAGGVNVPALIVRRANTQVELRDGQSFAVAGLLQSTNSDALKQLPWLGEVPVIGSLFRSASFEKKETEMVMIVTPRLVQPAPPGTRLKTPFEDNVPANDVDRFLLGRQETPKTAKTVSVKPGPGGNDVDRFLLGRQETPKTAKTVSVKPGPGGHMLDMNDGGRRAVVSK
jgi:pilus assembly protein CpaC